MDHELARLAALCMLAWRKSCWRLDDKLRALAAVQGTHERARMGHWALQEMNYLEDEQEVQVTKSEKQLEAQQGVGAKRLELESHGQRAWHTIVHRVAQSRTRLK